MTLAEFAERLDGPDLSGLHVVLRMHGPAWYATATRPGRITLTGVGSTFEAAFLALLAAVETRRLHDALDAAETQAGEPCESGSR